MAIEPLKLKNGRVAYKARIRLDGKEIGKRFRRKVDAEAWVHKQLAPVEDHRAGKAPEFPKMTIRELADYWLENYAKAHKECSSVIWDKAFLRNHVLPKFGEQQIADLAPAEMEKWLTKLRFEDELAIRTCNNILGLVRKLLNDAVRWKFIPFNPLLSVRCFKLPEENFEYWEKDEVNLFLDYVRTSEPEYHALFCIALHTGMRKGEIRALQWDAVDLVRRQIAVRRSFCSASQKIKEYTKGKRLRFVPVNPILLELLVELRRTGADVGVVPNMTGHIDRTIKRLAREAKVREIKFHSTRHTFASHYIVNAQKTTRKETKAARLIRQTSPASRITVS